MKTWMGAMAWIVAAFLAACGGSDEGALDGVKAVVIHSLGEDLSLVADDELATVSLGVASLGQAPNQIMALGEELLVLNSGSNSLQVLDPGTWQTLREYSLGDGCNPFWMAETGDGELLVTCWLSDELLRVDPSAPMEQSPVLERMAMPQGAELAPSDPLAPGFARPQGVAVVGHKAFVTLTNLGADYFAAGPGFVLVVDLAAWTQDRLVELPSFNPVALEVHPSGDELYVACASFFDGTGTIERLSADRGEPLGTIAIGGAPGRLSFDASGGLWAGDNLEGQLLRYDPGTDTVLEPVVLCPSDWDAGIYNFIADVQCDGRGQIMAACFATDQVLWFDAAAPDQTKQAQVGDGPQSLLLIQR